MLQVLVFLFLFNAAVGRIQSGQLKHFDLDSARVAVPGTFSNSTPACPENWNYVSKFDQCYQLPNVYLPFNNAKEYCATNGGNLLSIMSSDEYNQALSYARADTALYPFWIGLQAKVNVFGDTYYVWDDGRLANYTPWAANEPSIKSGCYAIKTLSTDNGYKSVDCKYDQPFICKQHSANCQSKLHDGFNGTIESPNYPDNYDNNLDCFYHITVPEGYVVVLTVMDFDTEATDTLYIWDGPDNSTGTHLIHELDGWNVPIGAKFESTSNEVTLHFSSDYGNVYRGWQFSYQAVLDNAVTWYNTTEGVITSPNYPDVYPNFYIEISKVVVAENLRIKFYVEKFTTEPNNDYLTIYNGDQIDVVNNTIATLSGHLDDNWPDPSPLPLTYYSTSNIATLLFYTDRTVNAVGFKLLYEGVSIE